MPKSFEHTPVKYKFSLDGTGSDVFSVLDLVSGDIATTNNDIGIIIDAVGYNNSKNLLYALEVGTTNFYSIDKDGNVNSLGEVLGLPLQNYKNLYSGEGGTIYVIGESDNLVYKIFTNDKIAAATLKEKIKPDDIENLVNSQKKINKVDKIEKHKELLKTKAVIKNEEEKEVLEAKLENVIKSTNKEFADIGDIITYNITFENKGSIEASNIEIIDQIIEGTSYVENSLVSNMEVTGSPLTKIIFTKPVLPEQGVILSFKVLVDKIPSTNKVSNKAIINYSDENNFVKTVETNLVNTEIKHGEISTEGENAIIKFSDRTLTTSGEKINYTIKAKNTGNTPIENIIVKDILPSGTSFVSGSTTINNVSSGQNPIIGINIPILQAGESLLISFKALVLDNAPDKIINNATINYEYTSNPILPPKKEEIVTNEVIIDNLTPEISIVKKANKKAVILGEIIRYSLEVFNNGEVLVSDLMLKDQLSNGLEYYNNLAINGVPFNGDITLGINIPTLAQGRKVVIEFDAKVIDIGDFDFVGKAVATYNYQVQSGGVIFSEITASNEVIIKGIETSIIIKKNIDKELVKLGDTFSYTIKIKNESELDAENVLLKDIVPQEFEIIEIKINGIGVLGDIEEGILAGPLPKNKYLLVNILVKAVEKLNEPFKNKIDAILYFRPDSSRKVVEMKVSAEDEGILYRDISTFYPGVVVVQPSLEVVKSVDKDEVVVGEFVKYTLNIRNTGNVDVNKVVVRDVLNEKLRFISNSVMIDGMNTPTEDVLLGIIIDSIKVNQEVIITFDAEVLDVGKIPNQTMIEYIYKSETDGINQAGFNNSNIVYFKSNNVKLDVTKVADKNFVVLRDEIKYTVNIKNRTKIVANNIIVKDELPRYMQLIQGSFKLNGQPINTVNLERGVNIGILRQAQEANIEYKVRVISNPSANIIVNGVEVSYSYILANGSLGTMILPPEVAKVDTIEMGMSNFKQFNIESYLSIEEGKANIKNINTARGTIDINSYHVIKTTPNISNEGQYLTRHKLIISGRLNFIIEYAGVDSGDTVYSSDYYIPFSTFIVLPEDYNLGSRIDIEGVAEDIYFKVIDERNFFANIATLINVKILF